MDIERTDRYIQALEYLTKCVTYEVQIYARHRRSEGAAPRRSPRGSPPPARIAQVTLSDMRPENHDRLTLEKAGAIPHLIVVNKADLPQRIDPAGFNGTRRVLLSARTGYGLEELG